jgi:hypothetical protein
MTLLRHAAALALVGWYLIAPPPLDPRTQSSGLFVDLSASVSKWDRLDTYESKAECEQRHREEVSKAKAEVETNDREVESYKRDTAELQQQKPYDFNKANALLIRGMTGMLKVQATQRKLLSRCVATDDPRLKEK